jgi:hypothetical protein
MSETPSSSVEYDYIVVGSGAGGGPLAARLARAGYKVLVLEAGGWDDPEVCRVPALHPLSTEDPSLSWEFFVRHYADEDRQRRDSKYVAARRGVFYPRAATVGGCTVHNAMITITGSSADWDQLASTTGDPSWRGDVMRGYFQRIERCLYQPRPDVPASDPGRHGFDLPLLHYVPHAVGGPIHLFNVTLNETTDYLPDERKSRDRYGENMSISSLGASIGPRIHGLWEKSVPRLEPVIADPSEPNPFDTTTKARCESLPIQSWMAISGAAVSPGRAGGGSLGKSLLLGLANLRTGYWWDSGASGRERPAVHRPTRLKRLLHFLPGIFLPQSLLLYEMIGRYGGPWHRYWFLNDGGFSENLAAYELIRRRVPRIVCCDAGRDGNYQLDDLGNFIRRVRTDFGAEIRFVDANEIAHAPWIPEAVKPRLCHLDGLRASDGHPSLAHAAVALVRYSGDKDATGRLLYVKSSLTADESPDVAAYARLHPDFPHESTADQFFDEAQWESYRKLGEHVAEGLFLHSSCPSSWFFAP